MYLNPFVAGVLCTIFTEMGIVILYAVFKTITGGKN